jgi:hypothetical protein
MNIPLPRFLQAHQHQREHATALTRTIIDNSLDLRDRIIVCDPSDSLTLRGIPAIGRGVAGAIRNTNPEARTMALADSIRYHHA